MNIRADEVLETIRPRWCKFRGTPAKMFLPEDGSVLAARRIRRECRLGKKCARLSSGEPQCAQIGNFRKEQFQKCLSDFELRIARKLLDHLRIRSEVQRSPFEYNGDHRLRGTAGDRMAAAVRQAHFFNPSFSAIDFGGSSFPPFLAALGLRSYSARIFRTVR